MVFDRHSFRELGCDLVWRRVSYLVGHRTSFVELAVFRSFFAGGLAVLLSRKPSKEGRETESSEKQKAPGRIAKGIVRRLAKACPHNLTGASPSALRTIRIPSGAATETE
jgi:hypothetical protein